MTHQIFSTHAPLYWAAGLPAIPLMQAAKRPAIAKWQMFSDAFPTKEDQAGWLHAFASGNIGLPMGPSAGLVAIDIDSEDPDVLQVLDRILPPSPWHRVGRKGRVQIYRWSGERTARIKDENGNMICEILSKGTQFVLPPSIHPDTKLPYTADGNLWEIAKNAPPLPHDFERVLKSALKEAGIAVSTGSQNKTLVFVPAGARDSKMVWQAGLLARAVVRSERTLLQVLGEMQAWVENFVEQVVGDPLTVEKAQAKVVEFVIKDVTGAARIALPSGWDEGLNEEDIERLGLKFTEDHCSWSRQKIFDHLTLEFERFENPNCDGRANAINVALSQLARRNPRMAPSEEESVLKFIVNASRGTRGLSGLRKDLAQLRAGDIEGQTHAELAEACRKYLGDYGEVRFDAGHLWQWQGGAWASLNEYELMSTISKKFGGYPAGRRHSDHLGILKVMKATAWMPLRESSIIGVNFANGFLDQKLRLIEHSPEFGMTYTLPYRYMPEKAGHMPMFDQFLNDSWSNDPDYGDKLLALQEMLGVSLMGQAPYFQRAFLLFGQAGAGKSVLQSVVSGLFPVGSSASIPPTDWSDRFLPAELFGKVINFAGEISEKRAIPGDVFKQIVSGEVQTAQFKNQNPFSFHPKAAHWFNSNFLPKTQDSSEGFNRRWLILEFNNPIPPAKRIIDLDAQILEFEREAIVSWAIQGYERLVANRDYTMPASHLALVEEMAADNNSVRQFLRSSGTKLRWGPEFSVDLQTLYHEYWLFTLATGFAQRINHLKFSKMMKELSPTLNIEVEVREGNMVFYRGLTV